MDDAAYKHLFSRPRIVRDLLRGFAARDWSGALDFTSLTPLPASYVSRDLQQRHGDLLWRIRFGGERWLYLLLLLEFQSGVDRAMAVRMLTYSGLLYQRLVAEGVLRKRGALPPVLPLVIYNGRSPWTAPADVAALIAAGGAALSRYQPSQQYFLLDEGRVDGGALPPGNLVSALIALETNRDRSRLPALLDTLIGLLRAQDDEELTDAFSAWAEQVLLPRPLRGTSSAPLPRLEVQDGTRLNFTRRSQTRGLGTIGSNQTGAAARGLDLHTTLAVNPDGVALGVLRAAFDAPEPPTPEEKGQPKPREERKSFRWVEGLRDCAAAAEQLGETRVVCTMDREADFLDLFIERRTHAPQVELLVRAKVDRVLGQQKTADGQTVSRRLFDEVRNAPARGAAMVEVRRLSARVKASKQPPKDGRAARVAEVTLRYQPVALPCPGTEPVELFVVHAREQQAPPAVKPLEWFVLTTLRVTSADDATRILGWYALRWRIEEYFRVLKSGCKVEELQHHEAERLERAMAIKMVVGWRIQLMVQLGRETPELPGDLLFSDGELRVLATFARSRTLPPPTRLGDAIGLVARLGGWLGRKRDPPGAQLLWHGYTQLVAMAFAFELRDQFG